MRKTNNQSGFTLIEILMVIAIIGVLAAIAVPAFLSWIPNMQLKADARDLQGAIMKAKGEAAKRNRTVTITFGIPLSLSPYQRPPFAYTVYYDADSNSSFNPSATNLDEVLFFQVQQWSNHVKFIEWSLTDDSFVFKANTIPEAGGYVKLRANDRTLTVTVSPAGSATIGKIESAP